MSIKKSIIVIVGILVLGLAYYVISPLFRNIKLDQAIPGQNNDLEIKEAMVTPNAGGQGTINEESGSWPVAPVLGTLGHPASGTARLVESGGKKYVRYENYKTINGPDLFVYLAKDLDASDFVNLGEIKATEGNFNYEIPDGVKVSDYPYVLTWCKQFGVLFNSAQIQ